MPGKATAHGVYDVFLGGNSNLRADREAAQRIAARWPSVPVLVRAAQAFHHRAAAWCAERGIAQFVRIGSVTYVPGNSIGDAAHRVNPDARVAYVIPEADPYSLARGLLTGAPGVDVVRAAGYDPAAVLSAEPVAQMLTAGPVCLIAALVAQFSSPRHAAEVIAEYVAGLPSGSYVVISAMVTADPAEAAEFRQAFPRKIWPWTAEDVARTVSGLEMVPPGVRAEAEEWPPGATRFGKPLEGPAPVRIAGAVARKP